MSKFDHQRAQILLQHQQEIVEARAFTPQPASASPRWGSSSKPHKSNSSMNHTPGTRLRLTALATGARQVEGIVVVAPRALGLRGRTYDPTSIGQPTYFQVFHLRCLLLQVHVRGACASLGWVIVGIRDMSPVQVGTIGAHAFQSQLHPPL